jgi:hypothetical protein
MRERGPPFTGQILSGNSLCFLEIKKARRLAATRTPTQVRRVTYLLVVGLERAFARDDAHEVGKLLRIGCVVAWEAVQNKSAPLPLDRDAGLVPFALPLSASSRMPKSSSGVQLVLETSNAGRFLRRTTLYKRGG